MLGFLRASTLGAAILVAVPAQAAIDLSDALVLVTDLGGSNYSFSQSGWTGGALVTGSFSGLDLDGDDQLNSFHGEISAFSMHFSGNGYAGAFSLGLADLHGLIYDLDGGPLGDGVSGLEVEASPPPRSTASTLPGRGCSTCAAKAILALLPSMSRSRRAGRC